MGKNKKCLVFVSVFAVALILGIGQVSRATGQDDQFRFMKEHLNIMHGKNSAVCSAAKQGDAQCHAHVVVDDKGNAKSSATVPYGYGPAQLRGAYNLSGIAGSKQTIAVIDAYDDPNVFSDLNTYSAMYGIPTMKSCPVASGSVSSPCFQKVNQKGTVSYPRPNAGWALETSLDVQTAHAICQNCSILLVEANSSSYNDLMAAVDRAVAMGAKIISNSYGSSEFAGENAYDSHFNHPGVAFTFSSGDEGYGAEYPASSPYVTAVGGTTLNLNGSTYVSETAWSGAGSGCSAYESQPAFQAALGLSGCANRMVADVSADADPNTGAAVYDSYGYQGARGWFQVGGTSLSSPIIAGVYALSGNIPGTIQANSIPYSSASLPFLHDVISGNNGICSVSYLCGAANGYDGPTGIGSPNGAGAF